MGTDRLGSIGKFYPYGQEKSVTTDGTETFTGYFRDAETGLDYADQRYHLQGQGRFATPDSNGGSGGPADPGSWNRYVRTGGDPINHKDPTGQDWCSADDYGSDCLVTGAGSDPGFAPEIYLELQSAIALVGAGLAPFTALATQPASPCYDTVQLWTWSWVSVGISLGASHSYIQIIGPGQARDAGTGSIVVTIEGNQDPQGTLVASVLAGSGIPSDPLKMGLMLWVRQ